MNVGPAPRIEVTVKNHDYRSGEIMCVTDAEYQRALNEVKDLRSKRRQAMWNVFSATVGTLLVVLAAALVIFPIYWGMFRGSAHGIRARQNAEREALRYGARVHPGVPLRALCEDYSGNGGVDLRCRVFGPAGVLLTLNCDDDEPFRNDGCEVPGPSMQ